LKRKESESEAHLAVDCEMSDVKSIFMSEHVAIAPPWLSGY